MLRPIRSWLWARPELPLWARLAISTGLLLGMVLVLASRPEWPGLWKNAGRIAVWPLLLAVLLVPANYGLEALKLRLLMGAGRMPWPLAVRAVLLGHAWGLVTPGRLGDYAGRSLLLPPEERLGVVQATLACRLGQLVATHAGAAVASLWWGPQLLASAPQPVVLAIGLALALGLMTVLVLWPTWPLALVRRGWLRVAGHTGSGLPPSRRRLHTSYALSALRYVVYTLQFALLLHAVAQDHSLYESFMFCALLFGLKSFIPSLAFAELGIRESLALALALWLGLPAQAAFQASLLLFVCNMALPALPGAVLMLTLKRLAPQP